MDFASLMSAQIAKGKEQSSKDSSKKYVKRSEIEAQREAAYRAEQIALEEARKEKLEKKRKAEEEEADRERERIEKRRKLADESKRRRQEEEAAVERERRKRLGLPDIEAKTEQDGGSPSERTEEEIPEEELTQRLRDLGEPARLFGEGYKQRLRRLQRLTGQSSLHSAPPIYGGPIPTTLEPVPEAEMKVEGTVPKDEAGRKFLFRQLASYFSMVLREWDLALANRSDAVKTSFEGKQAYNAMIQARENMRPLFKKLELGEIEDGILEPVVEIVQAAQERRYVHANDGYLRLSIGKA